jgi:hypothetical protein
LRRVQAVVGLDAEMQVLSATCPITVIRRAPDTVFPLMKAKPDQRSGIVLRTADKRDNTTLPLVAGGADGAGRWCRCGQKLKLGAGIASPPPPPASFN